ncbi:MAG: helix-turn-helix domain-containing protein [Halioglobus sp.]
MLQIHHQSSFHIDELPAMQIGWQIDFTQLGPAKQKSSVNLLQTTNLDVCHFQFNAPFDQRLHAQPGYYSFGLPDPDVTGTSVLERVVTPGTIIVFPHNDEAYGASPAGFTGYGIHIRAKYLEAIAEIVFKKPLRSMIRATGVYALTEIEFNLLRWELGKWWRLSATATTENASPLVHREEALVIAVLNGLRHSNEIGKSQYRKSDRALRLVLDYVNAVPTQDISAVELCTIADCSQRWLEQCFKKRFGVTPKSYVKYLRLARLRRDLLHSSHPKNQTVSGIASHYGFWHMGQLAADYRKLYGELPSVTMKRS